MNKRRIGVGLSVIALLGGALLASPGCSSGGDNCAGITDKICDKACTCGSDCIVGAAGAGVKTKSKFLCVTFYTGQCANQQGIDYHACNVALDTAQCDENGAVVLPTECTGGMAGSTSSSSSGGGSGGGGGGGGGGGSSSSSSSGM